MLILSVLPLTNRLMALSVLPMRVASCAWVILCSFISSYIHMVEMLFTASPTGRDHIPPRVFKEMPRLTKQKGKLGQLLADITPFNATSRAEKILEFTNSLIEKKGKMPRIDEWNGFADLLANLIEKYASELDIENMSALLASCDRMGNAEADQKDSDSNQEAIASKITV